MNLVALYKTYDGEEFLKASIKSIYNYVSKIIIINSDISWLKEKSNTAHLVFDDLKQIDIDNKIEIHEVSLIRQEDQYIFGFEKLKSIDYDYTLIIDSDEVWGKVQLEKAIGGLQKAAAYRCEMITYIKNTNFIVHPRESCCPIVFVKKHVVFKGVRGNNIRNSVKFSSDIYFHHFTLIRNTLEKIKKKIVSSNTGDKQRAVDVGWWIANVWEKIPNVKNYHITKNYEHCWQSMKVVPLPKEIERLIHE